DLVLRRFGIRVSRYFHRYGKADDSCQSLRLADPGPSRLSGFSVGYFRSLRRTLDPKTGGSGHGDRNSIYQNRAGNIENQYLIAGRSRGLRSRDSGARCRSFGGDTSAKQVRSHFHSGESRRHGPNRSQSRWAGTRGRGGSDTLLVSSLVFRVSTLNARRETRNSKLPKAMARKRYLKKTPLKQAQELFLARIDPSKIYNETVPVEDALNRVTAEPVFAKISSPHYHASAMDGICVRAEDTFGASEFVGKKLKVTDLDSPGSCVFKYVDTGNALPPWANAVIMIEKVHQLDNDTVEIFESVPPWNHVRLVGEDVVATELLLARSHRLRPYDLGALLAAGHTSVRVKANPKVGIIPTGDELIQPGEEATPGAVIEFNSTVLAAFIREWGGTPIKYPRARDDFALLKQAVQQATEECDLVTIIAGSSAGELDLTSDVVAGAGELLAHGIDVMPGKPAVLGRIVGKAV